MENQPKEFEQRTFEGKTIQRFFDYEIYRLDEFIKNAQIGDKKQFTGQTYIIRVKQEKLKC